MDKKISTYHKPRLIAEIVIILHDEEPVNVDQVEGHGVVHGGVALSVSLA